MTPTKENLTIEITKKLSVEVPAAEMESAAKHLSGEAGRRLTINDIVNVCLSDGALINELQNFSILDTVARERFHIVLEEYIKTNELEGAETELEGAETLSIAEAVEKDLIYLEDIREFKTSLEKEIKSKNLVGVLQVEVLTKIITFHDKDLINKAIKIAADYLERHFIEASDQVDVYAFNAAELIEAWRWPKDVYNEKLCLAAEKLFHNTWEYCHRTGFPCDFVRHFAMLTPLTQQSFKISNKRVKRSS